MIEKRGKETWVGWARKEQACERDVTECLKCGEEAGENVAEGKAGSECLSHVGWVCICGVGEKE